MNIKEKKITALVVEPEKKPYAKKIENNLESLQREVGGYIQAIYPFEEPIAIVCAECAKLEGLPFNRALRDESGEIYDIIAGTFLVVGLTEDNFGSLRSELIQRFSEYFNVPETFMYCKGRLIILKSDE